MINSPFDIRPGRKVLFEFCKIYGHFRGDVDEDKDKEKKKKEVIQGRFTNHFDERFTCLLSSASFVFCLMPSTNPPQFRIRASPFPVIVSERRFVIILGGETLTQALMPFLARSPTILLASTFRTPKIPIVSKSRFPS